MTMPNTRYSKSKWVQKYSIKPIISEATLKWYKWCEKIGRREYLKKSKIKTIKFNKKHPGNLKYRVFKSTVLKNKNVNPELLIQFKTLIEKNKSVKFGIKNKHLNPLEIYRKMSYNKGDIK